LVEQAFISEAQEPECEIQRFDGGQAGLGIFEELGLPGIGRPDTGGERPRENLAVHCSSHGGEVAPSAVQQQQWVSRIGGAQGRGAYFEEKVGAGEEDFLLRFPGDEVVTIAT
jgi:hypothetical protein